MESQSSTRGLQQPRYLALPTSREALSKVHIRSTSEGSTLTDVNPPNENGLHETRDQWGGS